MSFFHFLFGSKKQSGQQSKRSQNTPKRGLQLESLEQREMLAVSPLLTFQGTASAGVPVSEYINLSTQSGANAQAAVLEFDVSNVGGNFDPSEIKIYDSTGKLVDDVNIYVRKDGNTLKPSVLTVSLTPDTYRLEFGGDTSSFGNYKIDVFLAGAGLEGSSASVPPNTQYLYEAANKQIDGTITRGEIILYSTILGSAYTSNVFASNPYLDILKTGRLNTLDQTIITQNQSAGIVSATHEITRKAPNAPGTPTVLGTPNTSEITIQWAPSVPDGTHDAPTTYKVEYSTNGTSWQTWSIEGASTLTAMLTGLSAGTDYSFRVTAENLGGTATSSVSSAIKTRFAPTAASFSLPNVSDSTTTTIDVLAHCADPNQTPPTDTQYLDVTGVGSVVILQQGGTTLTPVQIQSLLKMATDKKSVDFNATADLFRDLAKGVEFEFTFDYTVVLTNDNGTHNSATNTVTVTVVGTYSKPVEPTNVSGSALDTESINFTWTAPTADATFITGYKVRYSESGTEDWTEDMPTPPTVTSYKAQGLKSNTAYEFQVLTVNPKGESVWTDIIAVSTNAKILAHPVITLGVYDATTARITWPNDTTNNPSYKVQYRADGTGSYVDLPTTPGSGPYVTITSGASYSAHIQGLTALSSYEFRVIAQKTDWADGTSNVVSIVAVPATPAAPTLTVVGTDGKGASFSVTTGTSNTYKAYIQVGSQTAVEIPLTSGSILVNGKTLNYTVTTITGSATIAFIDLDPAVAYDFFQRATNARGTSANSPKSTLVALPTKPNDPVVDTDETTYESVKITLDDSLKPAQAGWTLYWAEKDDPTSEKSYTLTQDDIDAGFYTVGSLESATDYLFWFETSNARGTIRSDMVEETTLSAELYLRESVKTWTITANNTGDYETKLTLHSSAEAGELGLYLYSGLADPDAALKILLEWANGGADPVDIPPGWSLVEDGVPIGNAVDVAVDATGLVYTLSTSTTTSQPFNFAILEKLEDDTYRISSLNYFIPVSIPAIPTSYNPASGFDYADDSYVVDEDDDTWSVDISWTAPTPDLGYVLQSYTVEYKADGETTWVTFDDAVSKDATTLTLSGLDAATKYQVQIIAVFTHGTVPNMTTAKHVATDSTWIFWTPSGEAIELNNSDNVNIWQTDDAGTPYISVSDLTEGTNYTLVYRETGDDAWLPLTPATADEAGVATFDVTGIALGMYDFILYEADNGPSDDEVIQADWAYLNKFSATVIQKISADATANSIAVSWDGTEVGTAVGLYRIQVWEPSESGEYAEYFVQYTGGVFEFGVPGLNPNTEYEVSVVIVDSLADPTPVSLETRITVWTEFAVPELGDVTVEWNEGDTQYDVSLGWTDNTDVPTYVVKVNDGTDTLTYYWVEADSEWVNVDDDTDKLSGGSRNEFVYQQSGPITYTIFAALLDDDGKPVIDSEGTVKQVNTNGSLVEAALTSDGPTDETDWNGSGFDFTVGIRTPAEGGYGKITNQLLWYNGNDDPTDVGYVWNEADWEPVSVLPINGIYSLSIGAGLTDYYILRSTDQSGQMVDSAIETIDASLLEAPDVPTGKEQGNSWVKDGTSIQYMLDYTVYNSATGGTLTFWLYTGVEDASDALEILQSWLETYEPGDPTNLWDRPADWLWVGTDDLSAYGISSVIQQGDRYIITFADGVSDETIDRFAIAEKGTDGTVRLSSDTDFTEIVVPAAPNVADFPDAPGTVGAITTSGSTKISTSWERVDEADHYIVEWSDSAGKSFIVQVEQPVSGDPTFTTVGAYGVTYTLSVRSVIIDTTRSDVLLISEPVTHADIQLPYPAPTAESADSASISVSVNNYAMNDLGMTVWFFCRANIDGSSWDKVQGSQDSMGTWSADLTGLDPGTEYEVAYAYVALGPDAPTEADINSDSLLVSTLAADAKFGNVRLGNTVNSDPEISTAIIRWDVASPDTQNFIVRYQVDGGRWSYLTTMGSPAILTLIPGTKYNVQVAVWDPTTREASDWSASITFNAAPYVPVSSVNAEQTQAQINQTPVVYHLSGLTMGQFLGITFIGATEVDSAGTQAARLHGAAKMAAPQSEPQAYGAAETAAFQLEDSPTFQSMTQDPAFIRAILSVWSATPAGSALQLQFDSSQLGGLFNFLPQDFTVTFNFNATFVDASGTPFSIILPLTITGDNDTPVLKGEIESAVNVNRGKEIDLSGCLFADDVDLGETESLYISQFELAGEKYTIAQGEDGKYVFSDSEGVLDDNTLTLEGFGTLTVDPETGKLTLTVANDAELDEPITLSNVFVSDIHGAKTQKSFTRSFTVVATPVEAPKSIEAVQGTEEKVGGEDVVLTITPPDNAEHISGYEIQYSINGGEPVRVLCTLEQLTWTLKYGVDVQAGDVVSYKVRSLTEDSEYTESAWVDGTDLTVKAAAPDVTTDVKSASEIDVSWDAEEGEFYQIVVNGGTPEYVTVSSDGTYTYNFTTGTANTEYTFVVTRWSSAVESGYAISDSTTEKATTFLATPDAPTWDIPVLDDETGKYSLTIKWNEVEGATGYIISRTVEGDTTYWAGDTIGWSDDIEDAVPVEYSEGGFMVDLGIGEVTFAITAVSEDNNSEESDSSVALEIAAAPTFNEKDPGPFYVGDEITNDLTEEDGNTYLYEYSKWDEVAEEWGEWQIGTHEFIEQNPGSYRQRYIVTLGTDTTPTVYSEISVIDIILADAPVVSAEAVSDTEIDVSWTAKVNEYYQIVITSEGIDDQTVYVTVDAVSGGVYTWTFEDGTSHTDYTIVVTKWSSADSSGYALSEESTPVTERTMDKSGPVIKGNKVFTWDSANFLYDYTLTVEKGVLTDATTSLWVWVGSEEGNAVPNTADYTALTEALETDPEETSPVTTSRGSWTYVTLTDSKVSDTVSPGDANIYYCAVSATEEEALYTPATVAPPALDLGTKPTGTAGAGKVTLSWTEDLEADSYEILQSTNGTTWAKVVVTANPAGTEITGLTNGTDYYFRVVTIYTGDKTTKVSVSSDKVTPSAAQASTAPTELADSDITANSVSLIWTAPSDPGKKVDGDSATITSYIVEYSTDGENWTEFETEAPITVTSVIVTGLTSNTEYQFRVSAVNSAGLTSIPSAVLEEVLTLPETPGSFQASTDDVWNNASGYFDVTLTWEYADPDDAVKYVISQTIGGTTLYWNNTSKTWGDEAGATEVSATETLLGEWTFTVGQGPSLTATYAIKAVIDTNESEWSAASADVTTPATPVLGEPVVTVSAQNATSATLTWSAVTNENPSTTYEVFYRETGETDWIKWTGTITGTYTAVVTGLDAAKGYDFKVKVNSPGMVSQESAPESIVAVPSTPAMPSMTGRTETTVSLSFSAPAGATTYHVEWILASSPNWTGASKSVDMTNETSYTATGLTAGTSYKFRLVAVNDRGTVNGLELTQATMLSTPAAPNVATPVWNTTSKKYDVVLTWSAIGSANSYLIERSLDNGSNWSTVTTTGNVLTYTDNPGGAASPVVYRITAKDSVGSNTSAASPASTAVFVTTQPTLTGMEVINGTTYAVGSEMTLSWTVVTDYTYTVQYWTGSSWANLSDVTVDDGTGTATFEGSETAQSGVVYRVVGTKASSPDSYSVPTDAVSYALYDALTDVETVSDQSALKISLTWTPESGAFYQIAVYDSDPEVDGTTPLTTAYVQAGSYVFDASVYSSIKAGTDYWFVITRWSNGDNTGYAKSESATVKESTPLAAPTSEAKYVNEAHQIVLTMPLVNTGDSAGMYTLYLQGGVTPVGSSHYNVAISSGHAVLTITGTDTDATLQVGTDYTFFVKYTNGAVEKETLLVTQKTILADKIVNKASDVAADGTTNSGKMAVSWTWVKDAGKADADTTGFLVEYGRGTNETAIGSYNATSSEFSHVFLSLTAGTDYWVRITAKAGGGDYAMNPVKISNITVAAVPVIAVQSGQVNFNGSDGSKITFFPGAKTGSLDADTYLENMITGGANNKFSGIMKRDGGIEINVDTPIALLHGTAILLADGTVTYTPNRPLRLGESITELISLVGFGAGSSTALTPVTLTINGTDPVTITTDELAIGREGTVVGTVVIGNTIAGKTYTYEFTGVGATGNTIVKSINGTNVTFTIDTHGVITCTSLAGTTETSVELEVKVTGPVGLGTASSISNVATRTITVNISDLEVVVTPGSSVDETSTAPTVVATLEVSDADENSVTIDSATFTLDVAGSVYSLGHASEVLAKLNSLVVDTDYTITIDPADGQVTFTILVSSKFDFIAKDASLTLKFNTLITTEVGVVGSTFNVTINGVNQNPTAAGTRSLTGISATGTQTVTIAELITAKIIADVDFGDTLTFKTIAGYTFTAGTEFYLVKSGGSSCVGQANSPGDPTTCYGKIVVAADGKSFVYTPVATGNKNEALYILKDKTPNNALTFSYLFTVQDLAGGVSSAGTLSQRVTGTNVAPVATSKVDHLVGAKGDLSKTFDITGYFSDIDSPTLTYAFVNAPGTSGTILTSASISGNTLTASFLAASSIVNSTNTGAITLRVRATDPGGSFVDRDITIELDKATTANLNLVAWNEGSPSDPGNPGISPVPMLTTETITGSEYSVGVFVQDLLNLIGGSGAGIQEMGFTLHYDPTKCSVDKNTILVPAGASSSVDEANGTISFSFSSSAFAIIGNAAFGSLMIRVPVSALDTGNAVFSFADIYIIRADGEVHASQIQSNAVTVNQTVVAGGQMRMMRFGSETNEELDGTNDATTGSTIAEQNTLEGKTKKTNVPNDATDWFFDALAQEEDDFGIGSEKGDDVDVVGNWDDWDLES